MPDREEYSRYINSPAWKQKRAAALERAQHRCEVCGFSKWSRQLEVHHKTYERFTKEMPDDLMVVCAECHKEQDKIRAEESFIRSRRALRKARLDGWATKKYGDEWSQRYDVDAIAQEFSEWAERKQEW